MARCVGELLHQTGPGRFERYRQTLLERLSTLAESKGGPLLTSSFIKAVQDDDRDVRMRAVKCLGAFRQRATELVPLFIDILHRDHDTAVRQAAMRNLVQLDLESDEVIATLRNMLGDNNPRIRCEAARSFWQLRQWQLSRTIIGTLLQAEQEFMQDVGKSLDPESVMLLAIIWDTLNPASEEAVAVLITLLHDQDANMRQKAAILLRKVDPADMPDNVITSLQQALTDATPWYASRQPKAW